MIRRVLLGAGGALLSLGLFAAAPDPSGLYPSLIPPSWRLPLGSDLLGRDYLHVTLIALGRTLSDVLLAYLLGVFATLISLVVTGLPWARPRHAMRVFVVVGTAVPPLFLALLFSRLFAENGISGFVPGLALIAWFRLFKLLDSDVQQLRVQPYYTMTKALGLSPSRVFTHYVLPPVGRAALRYLPLEMMELTALHATLSFFGMESAEGAESIGRLIATGRGFLDTAPWMFWGPVLLLAGVLFALRHGSLSKAASQPAV